MRYFSVLNVGFIISSQGRKQSLKVTVDRILSGVSNRDIKTERDNKENKMNHYLATATRTNVKATRTVNVYNLDGGWSIGIMGRQYKNKGMAIMQAANKARREGKTLKVIA